MLPKEPSMLLSIINMKLRDTYPSLEALCEDMDESMDEIKTILEKSGYIYDEDRNLFRGR